MLCTNVGYSSLGPVLCTSCEHIFESSLHTSTCHLCTWCVRVVSVYISHSSVCYTCEEPVVLQLCVTVVVCYSCVLRLLCVTVWCYSSCVLQFGVTVVVCYSRALQSLCVTVVVWRWLCYSCVEVVRIPWQAATCLQGWIGVEPDVKQERCSSRNGNAKLK